MKRYLLKINTNETKISIAKANYYLTLPCIMLKNAQTYFKHLAKWTLQEFESIFDHFLTSCMKVWKNASKVPPDNFEDLEPALCLNIDLKFMSTRHLGTKKVLCDGTMKFLKIITNKDVQYAPLLVVAVLTKIKSPFGTEKRRMCRNYFNCF